MADTVQIDQIISEVNGLNEREKILLFYKMEEIFNNFNENDDENITIESAFGLWKDRNITKENLRQKAWKQK
ncbi:MAG: hypothetical protein Pg6A_12780 [Termitinemataceae bacterium]|jgi:hypothetical protein|nr:MAG: hypothetical protein Pg6A_12780 [Termitinemataceae bacterium]